MVSYQIALSFRDLDKTGVGDGNDNGKWFKAWAMRTCSKALEQNQSPDGILHFVGVIIKFCYTWNRDSINYYTKIHGYIFILP